MIILYATPTCSYCALVRGVLRNLAIPFEERDARTKKYLEELIAQGGARQVPFLVDEEKGIAMYESADIAHYLKASYDGGKEQDKKTGQGKVIPGVCIPGIAGGCAV